MKKLVAIVATACAALALTSCSRIPARITLPPTSPLASSVKYGVVMDAYVRAKEKPEPLAGDSFYLRKAQIVTVTATGRYDAPDDPQSGIWYCVSVDGKEGWVFSSSLDIHDSYDQATNAVQALGTP